MIYTVTLNPCLDVTKDLKASLQLIIPGGKGINVSILLTRSKVDNIALGLVGGKNGEIIKSKLAEEEVKTDFVAIKNENRRNIKVINHGQTEEYNGVSPKIYQNELENFFAKLTKINDNDIIVLSGSVPFNLPYTIYREIIERLKDKKVKFVVDARKDLLLETLECKPFLIKTNYEELMELFDDGDDTQEAMHKKMKHLQEKGAVNVIVSLGKDGAMLLDENQNFYSIPAIKSKVVNTVGSGDSLIAGYLTSYLNKKTPEECLKIGVVYGSATCSKTGLATIADINVLLKKSK